LVFISALVAIAEAAYGTQPPDVVNSDSGGNTAMGTNALFNLTTGTFNTASGDSALESNTIGIYNTASGYDALASNTEGNNNTASGEGALQSNTSGDDNSAFGASALKFNTTGNSNTASGYNSLYANTSGSSNTAAGYYALQANTTGNDNTAAGVVALYNNTTGDNNAASGLAALYANTTGSNNTASGFSALYSNTGGNYNAASGYSALHDNTSGAQNSASGVQALFGNKTGNYNTASGTDALYSNTTGSTNIVEGYKAGYNLTTGSNNIDIGNQGVAAESGMIRIGTTSTQTATYIAGIYGTSVTGSAVVVSSTGQLGVTVSSERYKTAIAPMGSNTVKLAQLRPVTFHLKAEPNGAMQYGLIAEEVAQVYPELVIRDGSGRIDGVRYDELAPMLLNEAQVQQRKTAAQADKIAAQDELNAVQATEIRDLRQQQLATQAALKNLKQELQAVLLKLQPKDQLVSHRTRANAAAPRQRPIPLL
jgi:hypothetical protein